MDTNLHEYPMSHSRGELGGDRWIGLSEDDAEMGAKPH